MHRPAGSSPAETTASAEVTGPTSSSLGGAIYFDAGKTWYLSALASVDMNTQKRRIDITRGTTIQVQGGVGKTLRRVLDVGFASYALWQVSDDSGADLPPSFAARAIEAYGFGPELGLVVPALRGRFTLRYMHDFASESRPVGQLLLFGVTIAAWGRPLTIEAPTRALEGLRRAYAAAAGAMRFPLRTRALKASWQPCGTASRGISTESTWSRRARLAASSRPRPSSELMGSMVRGLHYRDLMETKHGSASARVAAGRETRREEVVFP